MACLGCHSVITEQMLI